MDTVRRVVVHDKYPFFESAVISDPLNRLVLGAAALSLVLQAVGLEQVLQGAGNKVGGFDHVSFAVVAFLWLALGLLVFLQRRAERAGRLFLLSAAAGSVYLAFGTLSNGNLFDALVYCVGLLFFPPLVYSFSRAFSESRIWNRWEWVLYVPPLLLVWPMAQDFLHSGRSIIWRIALASVALYLLASIAQTRSDLERASTPHASAQERALLFGLIAGTLPGIVLFVVPLLSTGQLSVATIWQPHLVLLFLVAMSYAVLLFEFSEADLILRRGVVYALLTLVILVAYGALGASLAAGRSTVIAPAGGVSFVAVTIVVGALFTPIRRSARRLVDWLLYGRATDRWEMLQALSARLATVMQPDALGETLVREITQALHLRGAFLLRRGEDEFVMRHYLVKESGSATPRLLERTITVPENALFGALGSPPETLLLLHAKPLTASRRETMPDRYRALSDLDAALSIPLVTRSGTEAILCLRPKLAHDAFDSDDLELLAPIIRQATAALDNALLFSRLEEKVDELRHAYLRIAREQEAERARLARELHDGTAQELAGLLTLYTVVDRQLDVNKAAARDTLDRLKRQTQDAYQGVRRASHALRPLMLDDFGLVPTLDRFLAGFRDSTGIDVEYRAETVGDLPDEVELALFRIAQECLENVRKHSGARDAHVALHRENGHVLLTVSDSGSGLKGGPDGGIGLGGMRERVESVGGVLKVMSKPGEGVQIVAEIPVETQR